MSTSEPIRFPSTWTALAYSILHDRGHSATTARILATLILEEGSS